MLSRDRVGEQEGIRRMYVHSRRTVTSVQQGATLLAGRPRRTAHVQGMVPSLQDIGLFVCFCFDVMLVRNKVHWRIRAVRCSQCEVGVGISKEAKARAVADHPDDWLSCGKYGVIQLVNNA